MYIVKFYNNNTVLFLLAFGKKKHCPTVFIFYFLTKLYENTILSSFIISTYYILHTCIHFM